MKDEFIFVQLNNYPAYERKFRGYDVAGATTNLVNIKKSLDWLELDLAKARNAGKVIILSMHDADGNFSKSSQADKNRFKEILTKYGVSAVFAGHWHTQLGEKNGSGGLYLRNGMKSVYGEIPVFFCGSAIRSKFLLARFVNDEMRVLKVSSKDGKPDVTETPNTVNLNFEKPVTPHDPKVKGSIKFVMRFGVGYVAKFSLAYVSKTQSASPVLMGDCTAKANDLIQCNTGKRGLADKSMTFDLPADAYSHSRKSRRRHRQYFQKRRCVENHFR